MRLLLVEDDPGVLRFVLKGLREQAYAVDTATTGDDALYQAEINSYDLIILDVMIPGRDGFRGVQRNPQDRQPRAHPDAHRARWRRAAHHGPRRGRR